MASSSFSSSSISSGICTENEVKDHKYQLLHLPGPKGAYEARQVNGGFYVRVDMPGVPLEGVKLFKRGETHTVTFSGKAPKLWPEYENSDRVYGGYVVLDRNPNDIDVEMTVVNGSLRLFFPNADGLLHFFPPKNRVPEQSQGLEKHHGEECCHNKFLGSLAILCGAIMPINPGVTKMELHPKDCTCCKDGHQKKEESNIFDMVIDHINPYLLDGLKGVEGSGRIVDDATGDRLYIRVDMPGVGEKNISVRLENGVNLFCFGNGTLEHPLDEGGRAYFFGLMLQCTCCKIVDVKHAMKHDVLRVSCRRRITSGRSGIGCNIALLGRA